MELHIEEAIPLLMEALRSGPTESDLALVERAAREDHARIEGYLSRVAVPLDDTALEAARANLREDVYVQQQVDDYKRHHQERAAWALVMSEDPEVRQILEDMLIQPSTDSSIRSIVRDALADQDED